MPLTIADISELTGRSESYISWMLSSRKINKRDIKAMFLFTMQLYLFPRKFRKGNTHKVFQNYLCWKYPCHKEPRKINCLFCFCPIYFLCKTKECHDCLFIHKDDAYDKVVSILKEYGIKPSVIERRDIRGKDKENEIIEQRRKKETHS